MEDDKTDDGDGAGVSVAATATAVMTMAAPAPPLTAGVTPDARHHVRHDGRSARRRRSHAATIQRRPQARRRLKWLQDLLDDVDIRKVPKITAAVLLHTRLTGIAPK